MHIPINQTMNAVLNAVMIAAGVISAGHADPDVRVWAAAILQGLQAALGQLAHRCNQDGTPQSVGFVKK